MPTIVKNIVNYFQDGCGIPATLAQLIENKSTLLPQPVPHQSGIHAGSVVRWDRFGYIFNGRPGAIRGWTSSGGYYQGFDVKRDELTRFGQEDVEENWECEIQDVTGFCASKSDLTAFNSPDAMVETNSKEMIAPLTMEKLRQNLQHGEIRILQENSDDYFTVYQWDGRVFLMNSGGSHHFAAARYIASRLHIPVPLKGRLIRRSLNPRSVAALRRDFDMFVISSEPDAQCAFHAAMQRLLATYFWMPLPTYFCDHGRALLLPKSEIRSAKVAALMWKARAFDLGAHLSDLVAKQGQAKEN